MRTILVVEDSTVLRQIVVLALQRSGFHVLHVRTPSEGMDLLKGYRFRVDLLVSRLHLGDTNGGLTLAEDVRAERDGIEVLLLSNRLPSQASTILLGPFKRDELVRVVASILDRRKSDRRGEPVTIVDGFLVERRTNDRRRAAELPASSRAHLSISTEHGLRVAGGAGS